MFSPIHNYDFGNNISILDLLKIKALTTITLIQLIYRI